MDAIIKRQSIHEIYEIKLHALERMKLARELSGQDYLLEQIHGHLPIHINFYGKSDDEKSIDIFCWRYVVKHAQLEKYMLCSEYEKLNKMVENCETPLFTPETASAWLHGLKDLIYENVRIMCKRVYTDLITQWYYTGTAWNAPKKKRNNKGVDRWFIVRTNDHARIFSYWNTTPTLTDDLEKVCYLLDGKTIPERTLINQAKAEKAEELSNDYFSVRFCKNGNTHYKLTDETRERLNKIGPDGNVIGQDIKIKEWHDYEYRK